MKCQWYNFIGLFVVIHSCEMFTTDIARSDVHWALSYVKALDRATQYKQMMLKKKVTWFLCKKKTFFGRAVEGLFLSTAGPKRGWLTYLIAIVKKKSRVCTELH